MPSGFHKMLLLFLFLNCLYLCVGSEVYIELPCVTPNEEVAYCTSIFSCPTLMKALGTLKQSSVDFVKKSICCGWSYSDLIVCCGTSSNYVDRNTLDETTTQQALPTKLTTLATKTSTKFWMFQSTTTAKTTTQSKTTLETTTRSTTTQSLTTQQELDVEREIKRKLLPSRRICGYQQTDDRIYSANATALDEFPWLVHIIFVEDEEDNPEQYLDRCNGVLISKRYVLTNDYCATYAPKVRLGQYNTEKTVSCIENPDTPECTEPWLDIGVEEEIHHLDFKIQRTKMVYNLALLRLNQSVSFSDFIRPICLPLEEAVRPKTNQSYHYSGWGALDQNMIEKKHLVYNLTSNEDCYKIDVDLEVDSANASLMCLKPDNSNGQLACTGDEAGPILYSYRHQWFVEGIIMKVYHGGGDGTERCSNALPINAVRITPDIINWILDNIRS